MGIWPDYFKHSKTVVIPKPEKPAYNIPKAFHPIVLLNTLGKLFEKVIANWLQHLLLVPVPLHAQPPGASSSPSSTYNLTSSTLQASKLAPQAPIDSGSPLQ